jgi:SpoVK/Ycf46/Vps4 family AAA+-type ATPase
VSLKLPNAAGREKILRVHCRKLPGFTEIQGVDPQVPNSLGVGRRVDLSALAAVTDGLSGAELEFLVNEAAIRAVRRVSAALQQGTSSLDIVPHVESADFESSLASFFATRRSKGAAGNAGEILKNLWK